jgi:rhodanese-related sulfurtransferase
MRPAKLLSFGESVAVGAVNSESDYAGDIDCRSAWGILSADPKAQMVDVRTRAEWTFVGTPDLSGQGRHLLTVEWQSYPSMAVNPAFTAQVADGLAGEGADKDCPVLFLCRSGSRSRFAAIALTRAGYTEAYNISDGFEGDPDAQHHRGTRNGWKASGLPWRQS